jgi:hypothetical protein
VTVAPFATLVVDTAGATPGEVEQTRVSVRDQVGVDLELLERSGADDCRDAVTTAAGEFVGLLVAGEALVPGALAALASAADPGIDVVYGNEVVLRGPGEGVEVVAKPLWSPERLLGHDWLGHPVLFRTPLVLAALRAQLGPAWEHGLALRVATLARSAGRVARPLLRGPGREPATAEGTAETVRAHLTRLGVAAQVEPGEVPGSCQVLRAVPEELSVAVVIACRGDRGLAWGERRWFALEAARTMLSRAGHPNLEVVVVHESNLARTVLDELLALDERVRLVTHPIGAHRAEMFNHGVLSTHADVVVLLDEQIEVTSEGFVDALVGPLLDEGVGLTGARLVGPHGLLPGAGYALHQHRFEPMFAGIPPTDPGPAGLLTIAHEVSALGGGALALRRATFDALGGMHEKLQFLDAIDLSHKVRHAGLRRVWVPAATAYDLASLHRTSADPDRGERGALRARWRAPDLDEYAPVFGAWHAGRNHTASPAEVSGR